MTPQEFQELKLKEDSKRNVKLMRDKLTDTEISLVCFTPMLYAEIAWIYADKAVSCAIRDRVPELKKLSRLMKECHRQYYDMVVSHLEKEYHERMITSTEEFMQSIANDVVILYYSINQNLKTNNVQIVHEEQQTYAVMAMMIIDLLRDHNTKMVMLLRNKIGKCDAWVLDERLACMYKGMYAFAGVNSKLDYNDVNLKRALAVVEKRVKAVLFTTLQII